MVKDALREYHQKRNFTRTKEPRGALKSKHNSSISRFVVHKHAARRLHYDLRLELDGVLKSWAVTRGPSLSPADKRLAVRTEDHPLDYAEFEGRIPEGEYGAGSIIVWDRGRWTTEADPRDQLAKGYLTFDLKGAKLHGRWHLVHMKGRDRGPRQNWLLIKADDAHAIAPAEMDLLERKPRSIKTGRTVEEVGAGRIKIKRKPGRAPSPSAAAAVSQSIRASRPATKARDTRGRSAAVAGKRAALPSFIEPQLASLTTKPPIGEAWIHEVKFDGYRLIARIDGASIKLKTRSGLDWTTKFPSLKKALAALPVVTALIDGEVVVETNKGAPSFGDLQQDLSEARSDRFRYYLFDIMHLDGVDFTKAPLLERKAVLADLMRPYQNGVLKLSDHFDARGDIILQHACRLGLEGIVSKLKRSPYRCGRTKAWLKSKCVEGGEFVVIGYVPSTAHPRSVGSLALAYYDRGKLRYAGRVGSGFSSRAAQDLWRRLEDLRAPAPPLEQSLPAETRRGVRWAKPELVVEVEFRAWTADGILRHAVLKGLRLDKPADRVVREQAVKPAK